MRPAFKKVLIANRGEITVRIARTLKSQGIISAGLYTVEEADSYFIKQPDEAVQLESGSYLNIDEVVTAAKNCGADAVHPGYGFLAENAGFAAAVEKAGITFIGPSAEVIRQMGDKARARQIAKEAGVPLLQGFETSELSEEQILQKAEQNGYPLILKAVAGGGGKGIRIIHTTEELPPAVQSLRLEADRLYMNDDIIIERYLPKARHVEVQVFGDSEGRNRAIFDRDCSIQRNNQKIIEEAPAPGIEASVRQKLHEAAVSLADRVGYSGAGTVEFLYNDETSEFFFLEMNTRLQVEHPVTEMITGLDLVNEQLKAAAARPLSEIPAEPRGHAVELRVCAEKPDETFMPVTGVIRHLSLPRCRVDTGYDRLSTVSEKFDNMLMKLIVHGPTREQAIEAAHTAARQTVIAGVDTNLALLRQILTDPVFTGTRMNTRYLQSEFQFKTADVETAAEVATALIYHRAREKQARRHRENTDFRLYREEFSERSGQ